MLTIFANMMINGPARLQHLKDSFYSFREVSDNWLINIRGSYRDQALEFLSDELGDKMIQFELLDESRGWYANALDMIKEAKYDYVMLWLEDHINLVAPKLFKDVVKEMRDESVDYLMYSWWMDGQSRKPFELASLKLGKNIDIIKLNKDNWRQRLKIGERGHLVSLLGIFKMDFLVDVWKLENGFKFPRWATTNIFRFMIILSRLGIKFNHGRVFDYLNSLLNGKLLRFPKDRPFDFERSPYRFDILPFTMGLAKQELAGCIDDDLSLEGTQLIKRGLYPKNIKLQIDFGDKISYDLVSEEVLSDNDFYVIKRIFLKVGGKFSKKYCQSDHRIDKLPVLTIINQGVDLELTIDNQSLVIKKDETATIHPNLPYILSVKGGDGQFLLIVPKSLLK